MPNPTQLANLRGRLEDERLRLAGQIAALDADNEDSPAYDDNFADSGQVAAEQGENQALRSQFQEQLEDVERALAKFDDDTYGQCEVCGRPIAEARLEAMPATRFCIDHA